MKNATIEFVEPTPTLRTFVIENKIVDTLVNEIRLIPNFEALRLSLDLALHICNLIEALVEENNVKANKQEIYLKCAIRLGWNKPDDEIFIKNSISFLHSSKAIKQVPFLKKLWGRIRHFLSLIKIQ
jgi:hypothetical protein